MPYFYVDIVMSTSATFALYCFIIFNYSVKIWGFGCVQNTKYSFARKLAIRNKQVNAIYYLVKFVQVNGRGFYVLMRAVTFLVSSRAAAHSPPLPE